MKKKMQAAQRKLTPLNAWAFSFACMIGWGAFVMPGTVFLPKGGIRGSLLAFLVAAVLMSVISLNYHFLGNLYQSKGGIYNLVKMSTTRSHAFAAAWAMGLAHLCCLALNARALGMLVRTVMEVYLHIKFRVHLLGSGTLLIEAAVVALEMIIIGQINVRGIRQLSRIQTIGAVTLLSGIVIMLAAAIITAEDPARTLTPAYYPGAHPLRGFLAIFILMPWAYVGFDSLSKVTEATGFSTRHLGRILIIAVLCGTFAYVANIFIALLGIPADYAGWPAYLDKIETLSGVKAYPVLQTARNSMGKIGIIVFFAAAASATVTGLVGFSMSSSRLVYQMAEDGVLMKGLAELHPQRKTPANAVWSVVFVAFVLLVLLNTFDAVEELASIATAVGYGYCSVSALYHAVRDKKMKFVVTGALGVAAAGTWIVFMLVPLEGINAGISKEAIVFAAIWVFLGIFAYVFSTRKTKSILK